MVVEGWLYPMGAMGRPYGSVVAAGGSYWGAGREKSLYPLMVLGGRLNCAIGPEGWSQSPMGPDGGSYCGSGPEGWSYPIGPEGRSYCGSGPDGWLYPIGPSYLIGPS